MNIFKTIVAVILFTFVSCQEILAQAVSVEIAGETTVTVNDYRFYDAIFRNSSGQQVTGPEAQQFNWYISGGNSSVYGEDYCQIQWTDAGAQSVEYELYTVDNYFWDYLAVTVYSQIPEAPVATNANSFTASSFTANWSTVPVATGYRLDVSTDDLFSTILTNYNNLPVTGMSKSVTGLSPGTTYFYRLRAVNGPYTSSNSNTIQAVTIPAAPVATGATVLTSSSFTANWNSVAGATGYRLDVSTSSTFPSNITGYSNLPVSGTSINVTGLTSKTKYYYRVRAANTSGISANSNTILATDLDQNYIRSIGVTVPGKTTLALVESATVDECLTEYNFFDGLGRPMQSVLMKNSPLQKDIVQPVAYDAVGREPRQYLPYVDETNGWYKPNALKDPTTTETAEPAIYRSGKQFSFYQTGGVLANDQFPYAETLFEQSSLNRVLEQGAPGSTWQPDVTSTYTAPVLTDKSVKYAYDYNITGEVLLWTYTYPAVSSPNLLGLVNAGTASAPVYYAANHLYKNKTKDEHNNEVITYVDKEGRTVLKRVQVASGTPTVNDTNYASTYYVYDDLGNLVCVIPPVAVSKVATEYFHAAATNATKESFLKRWAFRYKYDARKRLIQKQVPGAGQVFMVYDARDRLVLTQDSAQRASSPKRWLFTKYDELNRPVATGIKDTAVALTQVEMQGQVNVHYTKPWAKWGETYIGSVTGNLHGYTNKSYPVVTTVAAVDFTKYLTITYYDTYDFCSLWNGDYGYVSDGLSQTVNGILYQQPGTDEENTRVRGQVTGTLSKVLDGSIIGGFTWLKSVNYYDHKYRLIQIKTDNYKGGIDRLSSLYDFTGKVLKTKITHAESDVAWIDVAGATVNGNKLIRTAAGSSWTASGAVSRQQLPAGQDGWVELTVTEGTNKMIGLADTNPDLNYTSIDYAFYLHGAVLNIYENGVLKHSAAAVLKPGEVLRIGRVGTVIRYYRNDMVNAIFTSVTPSSTMLMVDASIASVNATLAGVRTSFGADTLTIKRRFEYDHAGRLKSVFHAIGDPVTWTNFTGSSGSGNVLTKTGTTTGWNAGASSLQSIQAGKDGWVEFRAQETNTAKMVGFSDSDVNVNYTSIDYAIYTQNNAVVSIYENGVSKGSFGAYTVNDVFRIERRGGIIYYKKNGNVLYTSAVSSSTVLYADCSLYTTAATVAYTYFGEGTGTSEVEVARNDYNELGQLIDKKLHSASATAFKQSVDYRYNIRGWLTSMNNSQLINDGVTNDDTGDYFGMNLGYNSDIGVANSALYNGNISAIKWSNYLGQATVKEKSYTYGYDPMNRLTGAGFKEKTTTWNAATNNGFSESGYTYDLNGNIMSLTRHDKRGSTTIMDNLTYNYGATTTQSNKLLKVTDAGDDFAGFIDGTNTGNDYTYDANGSMITDQNKGITAAITYNYLNLPELVTRGGNTVRYIYDATGRKLAQVATFSGTTKQTDYAGEFIYENDVLQFLNHEEGRVVVAGTKLVYTNPGESIVDITASNATLEVITQSGTEKYVKATSTGTVARTGMFPVGGTFPVVAGERYRIRVKGYRDKGAAASSSAAYLLIQANGADLGWPGAAVPLSLTTAQTESWIEQIVTIPAGATALQAGVIWNTVLAGEVIYLNEFEITKLENTAPEYQYTLKDHLGNVRLTFTTKSETETSKATLETANASTEQGQFVYYNEAIKVDYAPFDHTNAGPTYYSTRLTGGNTDAKFGLTKTLSVMPGDVVNMEVYAKYLDPTSSNWTTALNDFITAIANGTAPAGTLVDGGVAGSIGGGTYPISTIDHAAETGTPPKAYLNYIVLDRTMTTVLNVGYARITANSREYGQDGAHDRLALTYTAKEPGYVYIYLSNENPTAVEVYFDDFKVDHVKSPIIQTEDYYPFGLAFNSYNRENSALNQYKFNGKEEQDELGLGWLDFGARMYDASLGRWNKIDRLSEKFAPLSPYTYAACNPIIYIDINGDDIYYFDEKGYYTGYMVKDGGPNRGVYGGEEFIFGDQEHDHLNLVHHNEKDEINYDNNTWFRVEVENGLDIDKRLDDAGVFDVNNKWDGLKKALESKGEGRLDFGVGMENDDAKFGTHTIISTAKGKVSFSSRNYGNFLLAIAFALMTDGMIDGEDTKTLANLYELKKFKRKDSRDDQKAIELGGEYYKDHYSDKNSGEYNKRSSDKNYSDDFLKWYYDKDEDEDEDKK